MIYFLINNDYHLFDARDHAHHLMSFGLSSSLIEIPHTLNEPNRERGFTGKVSLTSPSCGRRWLNAWPRYFAAAREVDSIFEPNADDVLFMYTEYELLNHMVAVRFKRAAARVYLIEDGGVGTYLPFSLRSGEALTAKERVVALMTRCLPRLSQTSFHKLNGVVYPWLDDEYLDGVCLYRSLRIVRKVPVYILPSPSNKKIKTKQQKLSSTSAATAAMHSVTRSRLTGQAMARAQTDDHLGDRHAYRNPDYGRVLRGCRQRRKQHCR